MIYTKNHSNYQVTCNGKFFSTGLNNYQGVLDFIEECEIKAALEAMPQDEYERLMSKDDSCNEDYTSEVHREFINHEEI